MSWKSIDESEPVVVLRGLPATLPQSYERFYGGRKLTFGLLVLCLQRIISWSIAGAAHLIVAAALLALYIHVQPEEESLLQASLWKGNAGEEGKKVEAPKPEPPAEQEKKSPEPPVEEPKPEPPKPEPPKPPPEPEPVVKPPDPEPPAPAPNPVVGAAAADPKPATVGTGASAAGPPAKSDVSDKEVEKDPTGALRKRRAGEIGKLRSGSRKEIVVVSGGYDNVQEVLDRLDIPYTLMDPDRLPHANLSECKILLINCHNTYSAGLFRGGNAAALQKEIDQLAAKEDALRRRIQQTKDKQAVFRLGLELLQVTSRLSELRGTLEASTGVGSLVENVKRFVEGGGYLFTSDWGLTILERSFPAYVKNGGNVGPRTVAIRPRAGKESHPLLEEVFYTAAKGSTAVMRKFMWEIDSASYLIKIEKPAAVEAIVESGDLARHSAVAVAFSPEKAPGIDRAGRVLHILSHFKNQATKQGDYALQNLLLNFMLDRVAPK